MWNQLLSSPVTDKETYTGSIADDMSYGVSSMQGWRGNMEDTFIAETNVYAVVDDDLMSKISEKKLETVEVNNVSSTPGEETTTAVISLPGHALFAVFDGHGGKFSAQYCRDNYFRVLSQQPLFAEYAIFYQEEMNMKLVSPKEREQYLRLGGLDFLEGALKQSFVDIDCEIAMAIKESPHPNAKMPFPLQPSGTNGSATAKPLAPPGQNPTTLDEDDSGTTACCVLVTPDWMVCANAGDSRAVFSRSGIAIPLSFDHTPNREGEKRRILAAGGHVTHDRVDGEQAPSRGLGDLRYKHPPSVLANIDLATQTPKRPVQDEVKQPQDQKVSPVPGIIKVARDQEEDEFIVLACDGIWEVLSNQACVEEVSKSFKSGESDVGLLCEEVCI